MAGHEWEDWFEREELIGQISDIRVQNLQVERELVQKRTFTRWMNLHLEKCDPPMEVHDLFRDIQDGHILMALLEELSGCKLLHGFKKSSHRIFRLNNIAKVLSFLEERNVKLVSIDAADVADGNASIILGLIWNIILFFQIKELTGNIRSQFPSSSSLSSIPTSSDSDTSFCGTPSDERQAASAAMREHSKAIKKLLQWVQKRTRKFGVAVQDFGKSWISGLAFLAVIKSIDSSLVDMRRALLRTARENLEEAFRTAHYSLGIPRLLEPEDVTIDRPDEQSIMIYVSQFLEHFPGIEEPEEPCQMFERSISMCRLNSRDSDSDHVRMNDAPGGRVKERSYRFQRDCAQLPPKILISSVSEDRGIRSRPFRSAAARSWSSEDLLADSPCVEAISPNNVVEEPKKAGNDVLIDSTSYFQQLSSDHSPSGSSEPESVNTDSVIGDSAISSPDSWVDSVFAVVPEKFGESRSNSSLCDSGTAWDVYRATPVEVTAIDEGFVPYMEDGAPDGQSITESYIDEGIYSLSSIESIQGRVQGQGEGFRVEGTDHDRSEAELRAEQGGEAPREPFGLCDPEAVVHTGAEELFEIFSYTEVPHADYFEKLPKPASVEENSMEEPERLNKAVGLISDAQDIEGHTNGVPESRTEGNNSEVEVETTCQEADFPLEESGSVEEVDGGLVETQSKANDGALKDELCSHESFSSEICDALPGSHPTIQDGEGSNTIGINIPRISFSSEPGEQAEEGACDPERQHHALDLDRQLGSDPNVTSPQQPAEFNTESSDNDGKSQAEFPSCLASENKELATSEQIRGGENGHFDDGDEEDAPSRSWSSDIKDEESENKQELESLQPDCLTGNTEKNFKALVSTEDAEGQPEQEIHSTDQLDGHKQTFSDTETGTTQQITLDPVQSNPNGTGGMPCCDEGSGSRDLDLLYSDFDRHSRTDVLVGDRLEPMDLFYPDKDESMFTEPPDTEMQSWPSVLSVSALQPAPASKTAPDDPPFVLLGEEFPHGVDLMQENERVTSRSNPEADDASQAQRHSPMSGERNGALRDGGDDDDDDDAPEEESEQLSSGFSGAWTEAVRQDENQIPPVLRHRKGLRCPESTGNQAALTTTADINNSDFRWRESWEIFVLLLLWLLLYCYWLLPQMDLETLPGLLLNLRH